MPLEPIKAMRSADTDRPFRLARAQDLLPLLEEQVLAVRKDSEAGPLQKARTISRLAAIALKTIEVADLEARVEALEKILNARKSDETKRTV